VTNALPALGIAHFEASGSEAARGSISFVDGDSVTDTNVNIEKLAREMKVLEPWETLNG
jgi:hypothetical protein